ncbi:MAG: hypothetical protein ACRDPW_05380 [Mycobacteriales bacterium]
MEVVLGCPGVAELLEARLRESPGVGMVRANPIETYDITTRHDLVTLPGLLAQIGSVLAAKLQEMSTHAASSHRKS